MANIKLSRDEKIGLWVAGIVVISVVMGVLMAPFYEPPQKQLAFSRGLEANSTNNGVTTYMVPFKSFNTIDRLEEAKRLAQEKIKRFRQGRPGEVEYDSSTTVTSKAFRKETRLFFTVKKPLNHEAKL